MRGKQDLISSNISAGHQHSAEVGMQSVLLSRFDQSTSRATVVQPMKNTPDQHLATTEM